jgi:hypothetical protein
MYTILVGPIFDIKPCPHSAEIQHHPDPRGYAGSFQFMDFVPAWDELFHLESGSEKLAGGQP